MEEIKCLDHGFVKLLDLMGNDQAVVQAARVSYDQGTKKVRDDKSLINYLMANYHTTPFEMCEVKVMIKAPIFVARQIMRHRTASINEVSARYSVLPAEFYVPEPNAVKKQSVDNKQGRHGKLEDGVVDSFVSDLNGACMGAQDAYQYFLSLDVSRELCRAFLPVNQYTTWIWKINLRNLLHFLELRMDEHAQYETKVYADVLAEIVKIAFPLTYEAFVNYRLESFCLSKGALTLLQRQKKGDPMTQEVISKLVSKREYEQLVAKELL